LTFQSGRRVLTLGSAAFSRCSSLQSICIPSSIETISTKCFAGCKSLSNVTFESGCKVRSLDESAFAGCSSLRSIQIPSSVTTISSFCFSDCNVFPY
jgi:hypothetical protein